MADPEPPAQFATRTLVSDALHGTSNSNAESILRDGFRSGSPGFLGLGVYFAHGNEAEKYARDHAEGRARRDELDRPLAILSAILELGNCVDLENPAHLLIVSEIIAVLRAKTKKDYTEGDAITLLAEKQAIDTVRGPLTQPMWPGARLARRVETHFICVRNPSKILDLRLKATWN